MISAVSRYNIVDVVTSLIAVTMMTPFSQLLQSQRTDHQRVLSVARQVAELHILDLEQKVLALRKELVDETGRLATTSEAQERLIDELRAENSHLRAEVKEASLLFDIPVPYSSTQMH